jgi:hypothetical protein
VGTYVVVNKVLDAPSVATRQLHDIPFQPPLGSIACNWLGANTGGRFVIGTNPRRQAGVGHLAGDIAVNSSNELVMEVLLFAIGRLEKAIDPFRIFSLVETACQTRSATLSHASGVVGRGFAPMRNSVVDSLYTTQFSAPMACFRAAYSGSRSILAGMIWLVLTGFRELGTDTARDFVLRIGVERLLEERLKAAGSMSGILEEQSHPRVGRRTQSRARRESTAQREMACIDDIKRRRRVMRSRFRSQLDGFRMLWPEIRWREVHEDDAGRRGRIFCNAMSLRFCRTPDGDRAPKRQWGSVDLAFSDNGSECGRIRYINPWPIIPAPPSKLDKPPSRVDRVQKASVYEVASTALRRRTWQDLVGYNKVFLKNLASLVPVNLVFSHNHKDATMAPDKENRINNAIDSLIIHLIPSDPQEDPESAQERHDTCFDLVKTVLDR